KVKQWAHLSLPNGQIARTRWKEDNISLSQLRCAQYIKLKINKEVHFGEFHFFFLHQVSHETIALTALSLFGDLVQELLKKSSGMYQTI
ncbi:hypothetical protein FISHEDRAFT_8777, partial [Fistulina hepatica ATCC 64428]